MSTYGESASTSDRSQISSTVSRFSVPSGLHDSSLKDVKKFFKFVKPPFLTRNRPKDNYLGGKKRNDLVHRKDTYNSILPGGVSSE